MGVTTLTLTAAPGAHETLVSLGSPRTSDHRRMVDPAARLARMIQIHTTAPRRRPHSETSSSSSSEPDRQRRNHQPRCRG